MDCGSVEPGEENGLQEKGQGRQVLTRGRLSHKDSRRIPRHEWAETFFAHTVDAIREAPHSSCIQS